MAMKAMLFLLAYMLVLTTKVIAYVPVTAPAQAPAKTPDCPPKKAPAAAPIPLAYPPVKAKFPGDEYPGYRGCSGKCVDYCSIYQRMGKHKKRYCQRICSACCKKCKCLPSKDNSCPGWDQIYYHGAPVKCP